jgi:hypothetical protein
MMTVRHKATGEIVEAMAYDDCFGRHQYGYSVLGNTPMPEKEFFEHYEEVI